MRRQKVKIPEHFLSQYKRAQERLMLRGMAPASANGYLRALRIAAEHHPGGIDDLDREALSRYFALRLESHSHSTVSIDVNALKFYYKHVLERPWQGDGLFTMPRSQRIPDIVSLAEVQQLVDTTRCLSYRVFFFTLYSMGLRIGEGQRLRVGDIDADRLRVHVRNAKGRKDRLVPLPSVTLDTLRRFWQVHRNPQLLFPARAGGVECSRVTSKPLEISGVQKTLRLVREECGLKKRSHHTACATATPHT